MRTSQLVCDYLTLLQVPALRERLREPPGGRSVDKTARWLRLAGRLVDRNAYPWGFSIEGPVMLQMVVEVLVKDLEQPVAGPSPGMV